MVVDLFGITLKYPSSTTNPQFYYFPAHSSQQQNELENKAVFTPPGDLIANVSGQAGGNLTINWWEYDTEGNETYARIFILSSQLESESNGSKVDYDLDCSMDQTQAHQRGFVNNEREFKNVEITSHFFVRSVSDPNGALYLEARVGATKGGDTGNCCQNTTYGVELYWSNSGTLKGKFNFYKSQSTGASAKLFPERSQSVIPTFYQEWFGVKFIVYNIPNSNNQRVRLELWLTNVSFGNPRHSTSNQWVKVGEVEDFIGFKWGKGGLECDAPSDDHPITWAAPFCIFGWVGGRVIQWNYMSFREIDVSGSFGEDPIPPENPPVFPDPTLPDPDPDPPTTPDPQPPDVEPPAMPTTLTKRLTLRREVVNSITCSCDGIQPPPVIDPEEPPGGTDPPGGGDPGGGGGSGTLTQIYNVPVNQTGFGRLATVANSTSYYLRYGQSCTRTSSNWLGKSINRVEITLGKVGNPTGNVTCIIRRANDSIAATLIPTKSAAEIATAGTVIVFENLTNTYQMVLNDKVLIEFSGGDINNYIKIFRVSEASQSGTKVIFQDNSQEAGSYGDVPDLDLCARIWTLTP